jgi:hypothetical protein
MSSMSAPAAASLAPQIAEPSGRAPGWRDLSEKALAVFCFGLFVLYFGLHCFRYPWIGDLARYTAAIAALYRDFLWPGHEALAAPADTSEIYTPYIVAVAGLGKLLGVTPYRILQLVGVLNLIGYVWAIWFFFRTFSLVRDCWIPAVAFLVVSLLLRDQVFLWSSETSYASMRLIQAYPSLFAWGVALMTISIADRYLRRGRPAFLVAIGVATAVLLLSHSLTASWVIGIVGLRCLLELLGPRFGDREPGESHRPLPARTSRVLMVVAAMVGGLALTSLWPYFDITRSPGFVRAPEGSPFGAHPFRDLARLYLLALPAAIWFAVLRRHRFLIAAFAATWLALQAFQYLEFEFLNRYAFFQAFFAQVAVAEVIGVAFLVVFGQHGRLPADIRPGRGLRAALGVFVGMTIALTLTAPPLAADRADSHPLLGLRTLMALPSSHDAHYRRLAPLTVHFDASDIVLMPVTFDTFDLAAVTGARVVVTPHAFSLPDYKERLHDVGRFLSPSSTPETRDEIIRRYRVSKIVLTGEYRELAPQLSRRYGPPLAVTSSFTVLGTGSDKRTAGGSASPARSPDPR